MLRRQTQREPTDGSAHVAAADSAATHPSPPQHNALPDSAVASLPAAGVGPAASARPSPLIDGKLVNATKTTNCNAHQCMCVR
jgi:hypothetical protein